MEYDEFRSIREAAGLPVPDRRRYDEEIEPAYMDGDLEKADFAAMSPAVLADYCQMASTLRSALADLEDNRRARADERQRASEAADALRSHVEELGQRLGLARADADEARRREGRTRRALLELVSHLGPEELASAMCGMVSADE